jgi:hypothetical protein
MCVLIVRRMEFEGSMRSMFVALLKVGAASALCAAAAYGFAQVVPGILGLAAAVISGALVYVLALRLFNAVPGDDIAVMQQVASRLPGRAHPFAIQALALLAPRRA